MAPFGTCTHHLMILIKARQRSPSAEALRINHKQQSIDPCKGRHCSRIKSLAACLLDEVVW